MNQYIFEVNGHIYTRQYQNPCSKCQLRTNEGKCLKPKELNCNEGDYFTIDDTQRDKM